MVGGSFCFLLFGGALCWLEIVAAVDEGTGVDIDEDRESVVVVVGGTCIVLVWGTWVMIVWSP